MTNLPPTPDSNQPGNTPPGYTPPPAPGYGPPPAAPAHGQPPAAPAYGQPSAPGYSQPPPGWTPPPPPGQPAPPAGKKSRAGLIIGIIVVSVLALCGIGGTLGFLALRTGAEKASEKAEEIAQSIGDMEEGDCIRADAVPDRYYGVSCSSSKKIGTITKVFTGTTSQSQDCPADTDLLLEEAGTIACAKSTTSEKAGQPGKGGGVIVAGDCLGSDGPGAAAQYVEVACADPKVFEKVTARVNATAECKAPAVRYLDLPSTTQKIVCLADGPGSAGPGECLGPIEAVTSFDAVPCGDPKAGAKVLARKPSKDACESVPGLTHWLEDTAGLPPTKFVCVKEL